MKVKNIDKNYVSKDKSRKIVNREDNGSGSDDSANEEIKNRRGVIPREWYSELKISGYDLEGEKIVKEKQKDLLQEYISRGEDVDWWKTIRDEVNEKDIVLTDQQLDLLDRIRNRRYANTQLDSDVFVEFEWNEGMFPLSAATKSKRSFMPSQNERKLVNKLVLAIRMGKIKPYSNPQP